MMNFKLTKVEELLCLCIRHCDFLEKNRIKELYIELGDHIVYKSAQLNGVASIVAHALSICLDKSKLPEHWNKEYKIIENKLISYMDELNKAADMLATHNIPLLALKNSGITMGMYPYFGACPMGDVDVLVRKSQFREAHQVLVESGYKLKFRCEFEEDNIEAAEHGGGAEYSVQLDNGEHLWFELQWRPIAGRWIQPKQEPRADELVDRSISIKGSNVRLLSPEDNLLQVALHTAKHTFVRAPGFRLHTDVDRIVSTQTIDWLLFTKRVKRLKTQTAVYFSLAMAKSLLKTPVPDEVLKSLSPSRWKVSIMSRWLVKVGIFEPNAPKWSRLGYMIFVGLLYDSLDDFISGVLPSNEHMKQHYVFSSNWLLPYYHLIRLSNLILRRENT
jgi:hypothetical protein